MAIKEIGGVKLPKKPMNTSSFIQWFIRKGKSTKSGIAHKKAYEKFLEIEIAEQMSDALLGLLRR